MRKNNFAASLGDFFAPFAEGSAQDSQPKSDFPASPKELREIRLEVASCGNF